MNTQLAFAKNGNSFTDTLIIANGTGNTHKAVIQLTRKYLEDFQDFGRVTFQMRSFKTEGGEQKQEIAVLNEHQATLLLTYMRNSDVVRLFKKELVKAFFELFKRQRTQSTLPPFRRRALLNRPQLKDGHFSAFFLRPSFV